MKPRALDVKCEKDPCYVAVSGNAGHHVCGLLRDGTVRCWGRDTIAPPESVEGGPLLGEGALGRGVSISGTTAATPAPVVGLSNVTQISVGPNLGTCARTSDGSVYCWGRNDFGQLGTSPDKPTLPVPTRIEGLPPIDHRRAREPYGMCDRQRPRPLLLGREDLRPRARRRRRDHVLATADRHVPRADPGPRDPDMGDEGHDCRAARRRRPRQRRRQPRGRRPRRRSPGRAARARGREARWSVRLRHDRRATRAMAEPIGSILIDSLYIPSSELVVDFGIGRESDAAAAGRCGLVDGSVLPLGPEHGGHPRHAARDRR